MKNFQFSVILLALALTAGPQALAQYVAVQAEHTGRIVGRVVDGDGRGVRNAVVVAYHVSGERRFVSPPTGGDGDYKLEKLPFGFFDIVVEVEGGVFVGDRALNLPPTGKAALNIAIAPFQPGTQQLSRDPPGSELEPEGVATVRAKPKGRDFWGTPKGVAILGTLGGAALLAIASGTDEEPSATVF